MWDSALESLGEEECLALLKQVEFGRVVVVTAEGRPEIFPVNFIVHGRTVVFTTASSVLQARGRSATWPSRPTRSALSAPSPYKYLARPAKYRLGRELKRYTQ